LPPKLCRHSCSPNVNCFPCPSHPSSLDYSNYKSWIKSSGNTSIALK
jgi:hypothetical protein